MFILLLYNWQITKWEKFPQMRRFLVTMMLYNSLLFLMIGSLSSIYILFVPPSISCWATNCPDIESLKDFVAPLKLHEKNLGGTHWSLLTFERNANLLAHHKNSNGFDSNHVVLQFSHIWRILIQHLVLVIWNVLILLDKLMVMIAVYM